MSFYSIIWFTMCKGYLLVFLSLKCAHVLWGGTWSASPWLCNCLMPFHPRIIGSVEWLLNCYYKIYVKQHFYSRSKNYTYCLNIIPLSWTCPPFILHKRLLIWSSKYLYTTQSKLFILLRVKTLVIPLTWFYFLSLKGFLLCNILENIRYVNTLRINFCDTGVALHF